MKNPIHKVISDVLKTIGRAMSPKEIYEAIAKNGLYAFKAQNPQHIVKTQLRRHSKELNFPSSGAVKYFTMTLDGRFQLLDKPIRVPSNLYKITSKTGGAKTTTLVSVPPDEDDADKDILGSGPSHSEIQWRLLDLGAQMGLSIWTPMADRGRTWNGKLLGDVPRLLTKLPLQFDIATTKTIENIDVLWLDHQAILSGFEVEHTTSIYSGLLRMSDLLTMQPNIEIKLYIVAPDERFPKFAWELARPTFSRRTKPLHSLCRFLPYTSLLEKLEEAKGFIRYLKPEFLNEIAEVYNPSEDSWE